MIRIVILLAVLSAAIQEIPTSLAAEQLIGPPNKSWTARKMKSLSLRDKIAQLIQIRIPGKFLNRQSAERQAIKDQIKRNHVGGVVLFAGQVYESAMLLNEIQAMSKLPLLVSADFERGASFRIADTTSFPWTMAAGATGSEQLAYQQGLITGREARALGVHWIFAPVMDVNNNPDNPVINIRSYGEDPQLAARMGVAFIRGAKQGGVLTTAKHFPGHGDTTTDTHIGLATIPSDMARLQSVELVPFKSAIEAGVDSVMTAHIAVPQVTGDAKTPATLSAKILTDLLRNDLHFQGLVITDALEMGGITNNYSSGQAAVHAIQAGADMLLLPADIDAAIGEVELAVKNGEISLKRINASVEKVLNAKSSLGLHRRRTVSINQIGDIIAAPESINLAQNIADRSITAVKDEQRLIPIDPSKNPRVFSLVLASDNEASPGAIFQAEIKRRFPSARTAWGNARIPEGFALEIEKGVAESDIIIISTLVKTGSSQNSFGVPENHRVIFNTLLESHKPLVWVVLGNPYALRFAPEVGTSLCTFSYSDLSQIAAVKALTGEIDIAGHMPVSIPGIVQIGEGLQIPKLVK